jgi:hypothetical protein
MKMPSRARVHAIRNENTKPRTPACVYQVCTCALGNWNRNSCMPLDSIVHRLSEFPTRGVRVRARAQVVAGVGAFSVRLLGCACRHAAKLRSPPPPPLLVLDHPP